MFAKQSWVLILIAIAASYFCAWSLTAIVWRLSWFSETTSFIKKQALLSPTSSRVADPRISGQQFRSYFPWLFQTLLIILLSRPNRSPPLSVLRAFECLLNRFPEYGGCICSPSFQNNPDLLLMHYCVVWAIFSRLAFFISFGILPVLTIFVSVQ